MSAGMVWGIGIVLGIVVAVWAISPVLMAWSDWTMRRNWRYGLDGLLFLLGVVVVAMIIVALIAWIVPDWVWSLDV